MRPPSCRIATPDRARTDPQLSETHLTCARVACHRPERGRESHGEREREDKQQDVRRRICLRRRGGSAAAGRLDAAACPSARGCQRGGNGPDGGGSSGPTPAARLSIRHTHRGPSRNSPPAHPARHARRSRHAQPSSIAVATGPPKAATRRHCAPISCPHSLPPSRDPPPAPHAPPPPAPPIPLPSWSVPEARRGDGPVLRVEPVLDSDDGHVGVGQQGLERGEQRRDPVEHRRRPAPPPPLPLPLSLPLPESKCPSK